MSSENENQPAENQENPDQESMRGGSYEVLQKRMRQQGNILLEKIDKLNGERKTVFGTLESKILSSDHIITEYNCIPRDMISLGDKLLFSYNVYMGLKSELTLDDVFSVYEFKDKIFTQISNELINQEAFLKAFRNMYQYYRDTRFAVFQRRENSLLMVFQTGKTAKDIKVFKWMINRDNTLTFVNDRSEAEYQYPSQYQFSWKKTTRDQHVFGKHPHVSIEDKIFVECIGGDITIKVEDNTEDGSGIYSEAVEHKDQTLDDGIIYYAVLDHLILLKMLPYREEQYRYFIYNSKTNRAIRIDDLEQCALLLPEDDGLIFPRGYYLASGEFKSFEINSENMKYLKTIKSPNGEDFLYVFYHEEEGRYVLLQYNIITKRVETPLNCNGYSIYADGEMVLFKSDDEAKKSHAIQIWQTSFVSDSQMITTDTSSALSKIGNKELVKGIANLREIYSLIRHEEIYLGLYNEIIRKVSNALDMHFWLGDDSAFAPKKVLTEIYETANAAVNEYEKVVQIRKDTESSLFNAESECKDLIDEISLKTFDTAIEYVDVLSRLQIKRGQIISLRELRYIDEKRVDQIEGQIQEYYKRVSNNCVDFLVGENALMPFYNRLKEYDGKFDKVTKVSELKEMGNNVDQVNESAVLLMDLINNLNIDDATKTSTIIDNLSKLFSSINQLKSLFKNRLKSLQSVEAESEFNAQLKLINQSVANFIDQSDTPVRCEEMMNKIMVQLEELEGKFADFDEYIEKLTTKREEVYSAFNTKKVQLEEALNRRTQSLSNSSDRILKGIGNRLKSMKTIDELNGYFASDLMVVKVRQMIDQLMELGDSVKAEAIASKLKNLQQDGARQLKDKLELFDEGGDVISLGNRKFTVNTQEFDLTTVIRDQNLFYHLTGTEFFEPVEAEFSESTREFWNQDLLSENDSVYRAEYLAYQFLQSVENTGNPVKSDKIDSLMASPEEFPEVIRDFMSSRYDEGYEKGIHDQDCVTLLKTLYPLYRSAGSLRFHPVTRALGIIFWFCSPESEEKQRIQSKMQSYGAVLNTIGGEKHHQDYIDQLDSMVNSFYEKLDWKCDPQHLKQTPEYLFDELIKTEDLFAINQFGSEILYGFKEFLKKAKAEETFEKTFRELNNDLSSQITIALDWITAFVTNENAQNTVIDDEDGNSKSASAEPENLENMEGYDSKFILEAVSILFRQEGWEEAVKPVTTKSVIEGMIGSHRKINNGRLELDLSEFIPTLNQFSQELVPAFRNYTEQKRQIVEAKRLNLRLDSFKPRVMSAFVRNKLLNTVYLPLIGANMAKQIGEYGAGKRTDLMGLLILISPPGYGKTTLMEYVCNRLGLVFMKINGPAIGHQVTSLDPNEAPNATAKEEIVKLNLALEMGNNIMLYLDDIQHCNPELLQKFISLCDAQRKIEGVFNDQTKTYDLKGKKVMVVMAGNPYTESGHRFRIPDMLANRADTYNLGDIIGDSKEAFELSYLENCLTSNSILNKLASRSQHDVYEMIKIAETDIYEGVDFEANYPLDEVKECVSVFKKLMTVKDVILSVNLQYIYSAEQDEAYRTEPSFLLQGSYRNMNKLAEKIMPVMNDAEVKQTIMDHYSDESQLLTSGAEFNLLRFKELQNWQTDEERERLDYIRKTFSKNLTLSQAGEGDPITEISGQIRLFNDRFENVADALKSSLQENQTPKT